MHVALTLRPLACTACMRIGYDPADRSSRTRHSFTWYHEHSTVRYASWFAKFYVEISRHTVYSTMRSEGRRHSWRIFRGNDGMCGISKMADVWRGVKSAVSVSNIIHSAIASQDSSRVTTLTTFSAHCTVHCIVGDFNVNHKARYGTIPYRTVCMYRSATSCWPGSWNCDWASIYKVGLRVLHKVHAFNTVPWLP